MAFLCIGGGGGRNSLAHTFYDISGAIVQELKLISMAKLKFIFFFIKQKDTWGGGAL